MTHTTQTLTLVGLPLFSALALSGCAETDCYGDTDDEVDCGFEDSDIATNSRSSDDSAPPVAFFACPSSNNRLAKADYEYETVVMPYYVAQYHEDFCNTLSPAAAEAFEDVKESAIQRCNNDRPGNFDSELSACGPGCTETETIDDPCDITDSNFEVEQNRPPKTLRGGATQKPECVYLFWAKAEGGSSIDCTQDDDGDETEQGDERSSDDANAFE
jgi:hypothetical protein